MFVESIPFGEVKNTLFSDVLNCVRTKIKNKNDVRRPVNIGSISQIVIIHIFWNCFYTIRSVHESYIDRGLPYINIDRVADRAFYSTLRCDF